MKRSLAASLALALGLYALPASAASPVRIDGIVGRLVKLALLKVSDTAKLRALTDRARTCRRQARQQRKPFAGCLSLLVAVEKERISLLYSAAPAVAKDKKLERRVLRALQRHERLLESFSKRANKTANR